LLTFPHVLGVLVSLILAPTTFTHDVAPILYQHCVTCHHPGLNSTFSLVTYEDVRPRARVIATVTKSRFMPPWKPERGYGPELQGVRGLTNQQIETIQRWVEEGAARGSDADLPPAPQFTDSFRLGTPDLILHMTEPYELAASGPDVFRNFVLPIPTGAVRYVEAIEFIPGSRAIHHANMRIDETDTSRLLDAKDPAPGYDGLIPATARYPDGYFFGWTPGQLPPKSPELAWRLNPGSDMVVQLHMRPTGKAEHIQVSIGLYFVAGPPRLAPAMLRLGKQYIDIPPGEKSYVVTDSYLLPVDVDVHAVQPHAHYRAKEIKGFATLPDGTRQWLIYIRNWDFDWQDTYRYMKPLLLKKGTTLTMEYVYDNSEANRRNPQIPPQRVHWGQNSSDEMGDLWIQVVTRSTEDLDQLVREFRQKVFREDILGYESVIRETPDDVALHDDVALLYMAIGRIDDAITHFSKSAELSPAAAVTHFNLGTALAAAGRIKEATSEYRRALELKPDYAYAHNNLGSVLFAEGNTGDALQHVQRALEIMPRYADAHYNLGRILLFTNDAAAAVQHYRRALDLRPDWPPVLGEAASLLATYPDETLRDPSEAIHFAERAVQLTGRRDPALLEVLALAYRSAGRLREAAEAERGARELRKKNRW